MIVAGWSVVSADGFVVSVVIADQSVRMADRSSDTTNRSVSISDQSVGMADRCVVMATRSAVLAVSSAMSADRLWCWQSGLSCQQCSLQQWSFIYRVYFTHCFMSI
jgi:hypothetical protein